MVWSIAFYFYYRNMPEQHGGVNPAELAEIRGRNPDGTIRVVPGSSEWTHQNGWNAGAGASLGWGRTELFLESRVLAFKTTGIPQARQMPFVLGINFY